MLCFIYLFNFWNFPFHWYPFWFLRNGGSSNSPSTSLSALVNELGAGAKFDASQLSAAAREWLDARITEQVYFDFSLYFFILLRKYQFDVIIAINFEERRLFFKDGYHL